MFFSSSVGVVHSWISFLRFITTTTILHCIGVVRPSTLSLSPQGMASATGVSMTSRDIGDTVAAAAATTTTKPGPSTTAPTATSSTQSYTAMEKLELLSETAFAAATGAAPPSTAVAAVAAAGGTPTDCNNSYSNGTNYVTRTSSGIKSPSGWTIGSGNSNGGGGTGSGNTSLVNTPVTIHHGFGGTFASASASASVPAASGHRSMSGGNLLSLDHHQDQNINRSPSSYLSTKSPSANAAVVPVPAVLTTTTPTQEEPGSADSKTPATATITATKTSTADLHLDAKTFSNAAQNDQSYHGLKPRVVVESASRGVKEGGPNKNNPQNKDQSSSPTYLYDTNRVVHMASSNSKDQHHGGGRLPSVVSYPQLQAPSNLSSHPTPTPSTTSGGSGGHGSGQTMMHQHQAAASAFAPPSPSTGSAQQRPQVGLEGSSFTAYQAPTWTSTLSGSTSPLPPPSSSSPPAALLQEAGKANKMMVSAQQATGSTSPNGTRTTVHVPFHPGSDGPSHSHHHPHHHGHPSMLHLSQSGSFDADASGHNHRPSPHALTPHHHPHYHHHTDQHGGAPYHHQHHHLHHQHHPGHHPHHPHHQHHPNNNDRSCATVVTAAAYDELMRQNNLLKQQLKEKDIVNSSLQHRVNYLENQIHELRQLPTGKISHIPVE